LVFADAGHDVQGQFSQLEAAFLFLSHDLNQCFDEHGQLRLEHVELADGLEGVHAGFAAWFIIVAHEEGGEVAVSSKLVETVLGNGSQVSDDVKSVNLELNQLWLSPSGQDHILSACLWIQESQQGVEELVLESNLTSLLRLTASQNLEDLSPQELLQLQVLLSLGEDWGLTLVLLVKDGIVDHLIEDASAGFPVFLGEVFVRLI